MNRSGEHEFSPSRLSRWRSFLLELVLILMVCWLLARLAAPLRDPAALFGLDGRYFSPQALTSWKDFWLASLDDLAVSPGARERAVLLTATAGQWLPVLAVVSFTLSALVRAGVSWAPAAVLLSIGTGLVLWHSTTDWYVWVGCLVLAIGLLGLIRWAFIRSKMDTSASVNGGGQLHWLVLPGWTLFTGLGWLWIADFAARGPKLPGGNGAMLLGVLQADGLFAAYVTLLLAMTFGRSAVRLVARLCRGLANLARSRSGLLVIGALAVAFVLVLGWLGHRATTPMPILHIRGAGRPYMAGEFVRIGAIVAIAWWCYKVGEWQLSGTAARRSLIALGAAGMLCGAALVLAGDMGPVAISGLAAALLAMPLGVRHCQLMVSQNGRRKVLLSAALVAIAVAGGSIWLWKAGLIEVAPLVSQTAQDRETARRLPFRAASPNLAQVRWLEDAASSADGFGLGRVPYCGARALVGRGACTLSSGAPLQMPSDMAFAGLVATWGWTAAAAIAGALMFWLRVLMTSASPVPGRGDHDPAAADHLAWLRAWLIVAAAVTAMVQVLTSLGGTLGWTPLAGVTLPLLGFGGWSLCCMALWTGLALAPGFQRRAV